MDTSNTEQLGTVMAVAAIAAILAPVAIAFASERVIAVLASIVMTAAAASIAIVDTGAFGMVVAAVIWLGAVVVASASYAATCILKR